MDANTVPGSHRVFRLFTFCTTANVDPIVLVDLPRLPTFLYDEYAMGTFVVSGRVLLMDLRTLLSSIHSPPETSLLQCFQPLFRRTMIPVLLLVASSAPVMHDWIMSSRHLAQSYLDYFRILLVHSDQNSQNSQNSWMFHTVDPPRCLPTGTCSDIFRGSGSID